MDIVTLLLCDEIVLQPCQSISLEALSWSSEKLNEVMLKRNESVSCIIAYHSSSFNQVQGNSFQKKVALLFGIGHAVEVSVSSG